MSIRRRRLSAPLRIDQLEERTTPATLSNFLTDQHVDLNLTFASSKFGIAINDDDSNTSFTPDDALLYVSTEAASPRPSGTAFDFIGVPAGNTIYRLPQNQNTELIFLGGAAYGIPAGTLNKYDPSTESGGRVSGSSAWSKLTLENVTGPGTFSVWQSGDTGPVAFMASANGFSADDSLWITTGGHVHYNWAFSELGRYEVTFRVSGNVNTDGNNTTLENVVTSDPIKVYFSVGNLGQFTLDSSSYSVAENAGQATVKINRVGGSDGRLTVNYATASGSALAGSDFTAKSGTVTFEDQQTSATISVPITDDTVEEAAEQFTFSISNPGPTALADFVRLVEHNNNGTSLLGSLTQTTITIQANDTSTPNLPPTITAIADASTSEDGSKSVTFTIGDDQTPLASLILEASSSNTGLIGSTGFSFSGSGSDRTLQLVPNANAFGSAMITVTVRDGGNLTASKSFTFTVNPVADTPTISTTTVLEDQLSSTGLVVTRNPADGAEVTHFRITGLSSGKLYLNDGTTQVSEGAFLTFAQGNAGLRFRADTNLNSTTNPGLGFNVQAGTGPTAGELAGNVVPAIITVIPVNDAPTGTLAGNVTVAMNSGSFANPNFLTGVGPGGGPDETNQIVTINTTTNNAPLFQSLPQVLSNGKLQFTLAANVFGSANVQVKLADDGGTANGGVNLLTQEFTITVTGPGQPPVANADAATVNEDSSVLINVLGNDTDPDLNTLSIVSFTQGSFGSVTLSGNKLLYTPNKDYSGPDSFSYVAGDGTGGISPATVTITVGSVNDAPVAVNDNVQLDQDTSLLVNPLSNDTDVDGETLSISQFAQGSNGKVTLESGQLRYTPVSGFVGQDQFTYTIQDPSGASSTATVFVTVASTNTDPVAVADQLYVIPGNTLRGNVVENDLNPASKNLSVVLQSAPSIGNLTLATSGEFTFTAPVGFGGSTSFTYLLNGLSTGTVTISARTSLPNFEYIFSEGDVDIGIAYEDDAFEPHIHEEEAELELEADAGLFHLRPESKQSRPASSAFDFIGVPANAPYYRQSDSPVGGLVFLGFGTEEITSGVFQNETIYLAIVAVDGPGLLSIWSNTDTGPQVEVRTDDGLSASDQLTLNVGDHAHRNWAFTAPGLYAITVRASGTLIAGDMVESELVTYYLAVDPLNPAPELTSATSAITAQNQSVRIPMWVSDTESTELTVRLTPINGSWQLADRSGLEVSESSTDGNPTLVLKGTTTRLNQVLNQFQFVPASGFTGEAQLRVEVQDDGYLVQENTSSTTRVIPVLVADPNLPIVPAIPPTVPPVIPPAPPTPGSPLPSVALGSSVGNLVQLRNSTTTLTVFPFSDVYTGGVRVVSADFTSDGTPDLVAGTGPGNAPRIVLVNGSTGRSAREFLAFESSFTGGVLLAAADLNGDGVPELIVSPDEGGGPVVAIYDGAALSRGQSVELNRFFGIEDPNFRGGARVAAGDLNGDGRPDLVVSAGFGGGPRVAIFDGASLFLPRPVKLMPDFFVFEDALRNGSFPAVGDLNGDGLNEIAFGAGPGGAPRVSIFTAAGLLQGSTTRVVDFFAGDVASRDGVRLTIKNVRDNFIAELVTAHGGATDNFASVYATAGLFNVAQPQPIEQLELNLSQTEGVFVG
jgi:surface-anchored protein